MKKQLLILSVILSPGLLKAQITLTQANAPTVSILTTSDTANSVKLLATYPDLSAKTNATWDMTLVKDSLLFSTFNGAITSAVFPNATFTIKKEYSFAGSLKYFTQAMLAVTANGVVQYGESINRQAISLAAVSGGANDSLIFPKQDVIFSADKVEIKYPCGMGTTWVSSPKFTTNFGITIASLGLNKTNGKRQSELTVTNTVVGWGKMRVNDKGGNPTEYMDVLQLQIENSIKDSFFLAGKPAPTALLNAFGLTQGQVSKSYERQFLRKGEFRPLVEISYTDNTYSKKNFCEVHKQRFQAAAGTTDVTTNHFEVYPNPVTDYSFMIGGDDLKKGNLKFILLNSLGQEVIGAEVPSNGEVNLSESISSGLYQLQLMADDQVLGVKKIHIIN
jgi:hypothetical protein